MPARCIAMKSQGEKGGGATYLRATYTRYRQRYVAAITIVLATMRMQVSQRRIDMDMLVCNLIE